MSNNLNHYLKLWDLADPEPLAQTGTSNLYTVTYQTERVVLKLLTPAGDEEKHGAAALHHWNGQGAVRLFRFDDQAHLLEYASGDDLTGLVKSGSDHEATTIIADVLNQLHSVPAEPPPAGVIPLNIWFRELFNFASRDRSAGIDSIFTRGAALAEKLLADPMDVRVLHGDIHHENIRHHPQRGWLAFDPKGLIGERTYDAANTFCNPMKLPGLTENEARILKTADLLADKLKIDRTRLLSFVFIYACLSASWWLMVDHEPHH
ncbi:MAG: phosphotransferase, partial [Anaerolineae bacterium]|nr:phosphotransferase [Anaerolineae bacterium]